MGFLDISTTANKSDLYTGVLAKVLDAAIARSDVVVQS